MNLLFYTYSYTSYNPKSLKKNKIKKDIWWCFWGTGVPRNKNYSSVNIVDFICCPSSSSWKDRMNQVIVICLYFCSKTQFQPDSSQWTGSSLSSLKTLAWWRHWLWKVVLNMGLKTSKLYRSNTTEGRKTYMYWLYLDYFGLVALIAGAKFFITNSQNNMWSKCPY